MPRQYVGVSAFCGLALHFTMAAAVQAAPIQLPAGQQLERVDFEQHVVALLSRQGCNSGACHGSLQGRGGLYLSLFGYAAEKDHRALTHESGARRISVTAPDESLLLLKASGQVSHGGETRFARSSWQYQIIRAWIADGAPGPVEQRKAVRIVVQPAEHVFTRPDESIQLKVTATFADGTSADMTCFSEFRAQDDTVAQVSPDGTVRSGRAGATAIVATYRGQVQAARVLVPRPLAKDFVYPRVPEANYVDREVFHKLRQLNIVPSELSSDTAFLRRVTIDTIGSLPSPDEVRSFLASTDPDKRTKKIDELLAHPLHAAVWATRLSDLTINNVDAMDAPAQLRPKKAKMWHDWLRKRIADNIGYDELARGVLCATSRDAQDVLAWAKQAAQLEAAAQKGFQSEYANRASLDLFWRRGQGNTFYPTEQMAEHTAAAFLGVRIECAQCHKHPYDQWTQTDYRAFANLFGQVALGAAPETKAALTKAQQDRQRAYQTEKAELDRELDVEKKRQLAPLDQEIAEKRKPLLDQLAREHDERLKTAADAIEKESAKRLKPLMLKAEKDSAQKMKAGLAKFDQQIQARKAKVSTEVTQRYAAKQKELRDRFPPLPQNMTEIYLSAKPARQLPHPDTLAPLAPKILGGPQVDFDGDARVALYRWLVQPENPFFARSFVNRVWAHYFGIGLVNPLDNLVVANPASNERLLDALAKDFIAHKFDIRHLERTLLLSRTYQLSAVPNATNKDERGSFARSYPRRPMAEVVLDMVNTALGTTETYGTDVPVGSRAVEVAPNKMQSPSVAEIFRLFGRPPRASTCDCERVTEVALPQTMFLMTDDKLMAKMSKGRLPQLLTAKKDDAELVEELFLATLTRFPTDEERTAAVQHLRRAPARQAGALDVLWALLNTREFVLNH